MKGYISFSPLGILVLLKLSNSPERFRKLGQEGLSPLILYTVARDGKNLWLDQTSNWQMVIVTGRSASRMDCQDIRYSAYRESGAERVTELGCRRIFERAFGRSAIPPLSSMPADPADPAASPPPSRTPSPPQDRALTLRALVSTKDAGVIIGRAGKNVAELRDRTGVKAGVSKVIAGVHERVLTVTGSVHAVAKVYALFSVSVPPDTFQAYTLIIDQLISANPSSPITPPSPSSSHTSIRLLISHNLMGTIIGRNGLKIKAIQDGSGTRMVASKDMLPQSTERIDRKSVV